MQRLAFKMFLNPGQKEEYRKRHNNLFPELRQLLHESGVRNYTIYLDETPIADGPYKGTMPLFAYQEVIGESPQPTDKDCPAAQGSQDLGETDACKKWWAYMADIMVCNPDNSPVSIPLPEMFHMD